MGTCKSHLHSHACASLGTQFVHGKMQRHSIAGRNQRAISGIAHPNKLYDVILLQPMGQCLDRWCETQPTCECIRQLARSFIATMPRLLILENWDSGVRLICPCAVNISKSSSSVNCDTGSTAATLLVRGMGKTCGKGGSYSCDAFATP